MNDFKLIHFEGCPNSECARAILLKCRVLFDAIKQDDLSDSDPYKQYSSPTILKDNRIIFGQKLSPGASACSAEEIDEKQLRKKILDAIEMDS